MIRPWILAWIVLFYCLVAARFLLSDGSSTMEQAGPSSASSAPLAGTFLRLSLDLASDQLYDLAPEIPDVMGLRASAAIVKVMSVPDSQCIRVVPPDDHVNIGFHEVLLHDMEEEDLPFVALSELNCLHQSWPKPLFVFMSRYQHDLEWMRKEVKERFGCTQSGNCTHCGKLCRSSMKDSARYFPPWTVMRSQWSEMTKLAISGVAIDTLLFSRIGVRLFHRYRIISLMWPSAERICDGCMAFWKRWMRKWSDIIIAGVLRRWRHVCRCRRCGTQQSGCF